jgi:hypothetical protein
MPEQTPPGIGSSYAYWGSSYWDSGKLWAPASPGPIRKNEPMKIITILVSKLTVPQRLQRIGNILELSKDNVNAPGNGPLVAELEAAHTGLQEAQNALETHHLLTAQLVAARDAADALCNAKLTLLAGFTESATGGDPEKILSTGFGVRGSAQPPQPVQQILNVKVTFNGEPGKSIVRWKADPHADAYVVECCADPITPDGWKYMGTVPSPKFVGNGATPGQVCWYRVRGINREGDGPWSEPAMRPVM